ncbi:DnaJ family domain-containing protein [Amycolatopsis pigmentata]|uniref:DUF1992 domain-containing protein n=1 Tax=Amycolatopsis pigmentata TaxID=450801 RepID=A0ABW5G512_9PSEU
MTERKPPGVSIESWVERQIREAQEAGRFDNLPGAGKPLPGLGLPYDELWWVRQKMASEGLSAEAALPTPLRLRKEIERLPETVRPLPTETAVREVVDELNKRIMDHLRAPSGPRVPVRPVDADAVVTTWKAEHAKRRPGPTPSAPRTPPRRRFFRRRKGF